MRISELAHVEYVVQCLALQMRWRLLSLCLFPVHIPSVSAPVCLLCSRTFHGSLVPSGAHPSPSRQSRALSPGSFLLEGLHFVTQQTKAFDPDGTGFRDRQDFTEKAFLQLTNSHPFSFPDLPPQPHTCWPPLLVSHFLFWGSPCPLLHLL